MVKQKFGLQFLAGILAAVYIYNLGYSTQLYIFSGFGIDIGFFKWILIVFVFVGITNAVNLTDGLDGLVAGSSSISFAGILVISFWIYRHPEYYSKFVIGSTLSKLPKGTYFLKNIPKTEDINLLALGFFLSFY